MIEFHLKNTIDRLQYIMDNDMFYLLNKDNIMLSSIIKNNIINYASSKKISVIYNDFTNYILIKKSNYHIISKDYDINKWNMNYFKYKNIITHY
jgi:hypothetical protein